MKILSGKEITYDLLKQLDNLDEKSYSEEYLGEDLLCNERFEKEPDQYILLVDNGKVAGYINFFPTTKALRDSILIEKQFRDIDICGEEVNKWSEENDVFILSIVIDPNYRCKENIKLLMDSFIEFLNKKESEGMNINSIYCITVSKDGEKVFKRKMFRLLGKIKDNEHIREISGKQLRLFLEGKEYYKSYKDDLILFLPYTGTDLTDQKLLTNNLTDSNIIKFINVLKGRMRYEYNEEFIDELDFYYIGDINLLNTYDTCKVSDIVENGEAKVIIVSHKQSNMYITTLNLFNNSMSPSLLADRLSQDKIIYLDDNSNIQELNETLKNEYDLIKSGDNRLLDILNKKPENKEEIFNLLSAEAFNSTVQQFSLNNNNFIENKKEIIEAYDSYNIYTSERSVILIGDGDEVLEDKEELINVYYSLILLTMFQNITLYRMNEMIKNSLAKTGDLSYQELSSIYKDYALAAKFWDVEDFKYLSTKKESEVIMKSFGNEKLYQNFKDKLRFIDQITDLNEARNDRNTNIILGLLALFLAIFETQDAVIALINAFISNFSNVELTGVQFDTGVIVIVIIALIIFKINSSRRKKLK